MWSSSSGVNSRDRGPTLATDRSFEEQIAARAELLATADFRTLERAVAAKRLAWLDEHGYGRLPEPPPGVSPLPGWPLPADPVPPRQAFEILFFEYMGVPPNQLPVIEETASRITWRSENPCPTLEACSQLGLDTRTVCRSIYEKPTQVFLSRLDPRLRFVRDYSAIRPHAHHCRESIVRVDLQTLMHQAITEAWAAKAEGDKGYGAVLVMGDRVLARAHDTISTDKDFCQHGEFKAIRQAVAALDGSDLCGALLLSTCEPCPMCMGLAIWANVTTVIYGSSIADTAAMGRTRIMVGAAEMAQRSPYTVDVFGGFLKEECDRLYT